MNRIRLELDAGAVQTITSLGALISAKLEARCPCYEGRYFLIGAGMSVKEALESITEKLERNDRNGTTD
jgi:hypothetical protein